MPCSLQTVYGYFYIVKSISSTSKGFETGSMVFLPLSKKTRKANHLQMSLQGQHFFSYFKALSVGQVGSLMAVLAREGFCTRDLQHSSLRHSTT